MRSSGAVPAPRAVVREGRSATFHARRIHRWLGLVIGVQFVLWTVGGLYFSWVSLDAVHGDHLMRPAPRIPAEAAIASPAVALEALRARARVDSLVSTELVSVLGRPVWRLGYVAAGESARRTQLADGATGALRQPIDSAEAVAIARATFTGTAPVTGVEYLEPGRVGSHHEYRGQPLPAWAVHFGDDEGATAYVAAELGHVVRIRNDRWRAFDFLWMLHTMDFAGRDDFNNLLLRVFSVLGLATILSGFVLFALTWRRGRRRDGPLAPREGSTA